jgi:hypothetical protein
MWLFLGFLTALFFRRGPVLDHGKPILFGIAVEIFFAIRFGKFSESINVMILGSVAGLASGSSIVMLWTGFLLNRPDSTTAGVKWLFFGLVAFGLFLVALKQIPDVFSKEESEPQRPEGFEEWSEIQKLEHFRDTLSEPIIEVKPNYKHPQRLVGALFLVVGLVLMIQIILKTESRTEQSIMVATLVLMMALMPLLVRAINGRMKSKLSGIVGEVDDIRSKIITDVDAEIERLKAEQDGSR